MSKYCDLGDEFENYMPNRLIEASLEFHSIDITCFLDNLLAKNVKFLGSSKSPSLLLVHSDNITIPNFHISNSFNNPRISKTWTT